MDRTKTRSQPGIMARLSAITAQQHNERNCPLLQLVGNDDVRQFFLRAEVLGVVTLWRLRGVCRAFHRWAQAELSLLPRVVAIGGSDGIAGTSSVESLNLSTMRWSDGPMRCVPSLPDPRQCCHSVSSTKQGGVLVCGGFTDEGEDKSERGCLSTAFQWVPRMRAWSALPDLPTARCDAASVSLPDGRIMLIGGWNEVDEAVASVLALAADGSGWSELPPLTVPRKGAAAAVLSNGKVLVAGGKDADDEELNSAELWDPETQSWTPVPPMKAKRFPAASCVLPSGRVAVLGGVEYRVFYTP